MRRYTIRGGGHLYLPAKLAQRWGTQCVEFEDHDEYVVLRPAPNEGKLTPEMVEPIADAGLAPGVRRGSSGAGY